MVGAFVDQYQPASIELDKRPISEPKDEWCTNNRLRTARDFSMTHNSIEILGFHDGPSNMWAHESTLAFVEELKAKKMLRYSVTQQDNKPGWLSKVVQRVFGV